MATSTTTNPPAAAPSPRSGSATPPKGRRRLGTPLVNFWLDAALLLALVFVVWVSVMMQVVFPAPSAAAGWELWGLSFDHWRNVQFFSLCFAALLALEHLVLHWNWVCGVLAVQVLRLKKRPDEGVQAIYGVGTFIVIQGLLFVGIVVAMLCVKHPSLPRIP